METTIIISQANNGKIILTGTTLSRVWWLITLDADSEKEKGTTTC